MFVDAGPRLAQHWVNVSCLPGSIRVLLLYYAVAQSRKAVTAVQGRDELGHEITTILDYNCNMVVISTQRPSCKSSTEVYRHHSTPIDSDIAIFA